MILFHRLISDSAEKPYLVILHGLFGSGDNWQTHAKYLSQWFQVVLIDQRNHGHSPHAPDMSYSLMCQDLSETLESLEIAKAHFIGHSMGGKTVMHFAQNFQHKVETLMVIDMGIKGYPPHHDIIFKGLHAVDVQTCSSRKEAENRIQPHIPDASTQQFLLKSLYWIEDGKLAWRFNIPALENNIEMILQALPEVPFLGPTLFLTGKKSSYVLEADHLAIQSVFPHVTFTEIPNAGHWVHAEAPKEFLQSIIIFLKLT
jgi:pimeloyl-ACP methyl ester carboxylesterase